MTSPPAQSRILRLQEALQGSKTKQPGPATRRADPPVVSYSMSYDPGHQPALHCDRPARPSRHPWPPAVPSPPPGPSYATDIAEITDEDPIEEAPPTPSSGSQPGAVKVARPAAADGGPGTVDSAAVAPSRDDSAAGDGLVAAGPTPPDAAHPGTAGDESIPGWQVAPQLAQADDEAFAQDVLAILAHAGSVGDTSPKAPLPEVPPRAAPPAADPGSSKGVGAQASHDVFDRLTAAGAANRYDQGPVALAVDFDRLDRALDRTPDAAMAPSADPASPTVAGPPPPTETTTASPPPNVTPTVTAATPDVQTPASDLGDVAAISTKAGPFRVTTDVPLLAQAPGFNCHAAACASMVAWRDEVIPDPADVASASGYWERYAEGRTVGFPDVLEAFGLKIVSAGAPPSPAAVRDLIDGHGPLWLAASPPGEHAVVLTGTTGDGTASGTLLDVVDPWAQGMTAFAAPNPGSRYSAPFADVIHNIAGPDGQIVLANLREGTSR